MSSQKQQIIDDLADLFGFREEDWSGMGANEILSCLTLDQLRQLAAYNNLDLDAYVREVVPA